MSKKRDLKEALKAWEGWSLPIKSEEIALFKTHYKDYVLKADKY